MTAAELLFWSLTHSRPLRTKSSRSPGFFVTFTESSNAEVAVSYTSRLPVVPSGMYTFLPSTCGAPSACPWIGTFALMDWPLVTSTSASAPLSEARTGTIGLSVVAGTRIFTRAESLIPPWRLKVCWVPATVSTLVTASVRSVTTGSALRQGQDQVVVRAATLTSALFVPFTNGTTVPLPGCGTQSVPWESTAAAPSPGPSWTLSPSGVVSAGSIRWTVPFAASTT